MTEGVDPPAEDAFQTERDRPSWFRCPRRRRRVALLCAGLLVVALLAFPLLLRIYDSVMLPDDAPVIGVSFDRAWHARAGISTKNYELCLRRAGARIVELEPGRDDPEVVVEQLDGILLTGGGDVDPDLYGADPQTAELVDRQRDEFEIALIRAAIRRDVPLLGVCRGIQILNVALGGTLHSLRRDPAQSELHGIGVSSFRAHGVDIMADSLIAEILGPGSHAVNSFHGQAVDQVGKGLRVAARAEDGLVEALEVPGARFILATQWHPEVPPAQIEVFTRFVNEAKRDVREPAGSTGTP